MTEGTMEHSEAPGSMSVRAVSWLAWALCAVSLMVLSLSLLLIVLGWSMPLPGARTPWRDQAISVVGIVGAPLLGGLIASRRPENPYGWLFCFASLVLSIQAITDAYATYSLFTYPGNLPGVGTMAWISEWMAFPVVLSVAALSFLLFPEGVLLSRR